MKNKQTIIEVKSVKTITDEEIDLIFADLKQTFSKPKVFIKPEKNDKITKKHIETR